jgi:hypothetical protein
MSARLPAVACLAATLACGNARADAPAPTIAQALHASSAPLAGIALAGASQPGTDWEGGDDWDWVDRAPLAAPSEELSVGKAVGSSALIPGLGERYAGHPDRAKLFMMVEGAIWTGVAFYRIQGTLREDRQIEFANVQAGAPRDQNADYYEHIGMWLSLDEWQDVVRQDARLRFPDDPAAQQAFFEENKRYDAGQAWAWPDDSTRTSYRQLRSKTERSYRNARLAAGAAIFNRLASMVDALALARNHNHQVKQKQARLEWRIAPTYTTEGLVIGPVVTKRY